MYLKKHPLLPLTSPATVGVGATLVNVDRGRGFQAITNRVAFATERRKAAEEGWSNLIIENIFSIEKKIKKNLRMAQETLSVSLAFFSALVLSSYALSIFKNIITRSK